MTVPTDPSARAFNGLCVQVNQDFLFPSRSNKARKKFLEIRDVPG
jgi:hypothetical protein